LIKEYEMGGAYSTHGTMENVYDNLVGKSERGEATRKKQA
jgi:hypothetical protein